MSIYAIFKYIVIALGAAALTVAVILLAMGIMKKKTKMVVAGLLVGVLFPLSFVGYYMISVAQYYSLKYADIQSFNATSADLVDGVWDVSISHDKGSDKSPEVTWDAIDGASCYVVYMIDPDGNNWVHMKTVTTAPHLDAGALGSDEYIGPYPPEGETHTYYLYIFALREEKRPVGKLDTPLNKSIDEIVSMLNTKSDSDIGNIISSVRLEGVYPG